MQIERIKSEISYIKMYLERLESWVDISKTSLDILQNMMMDFENNEYYQKYESIDSMDFLNGAAINAQCPPRHELNRCGNDSIAANGFNQHENELNKVV